MNCFERYLGMVKGMEVDIIPRVPILMQFAAEYIHSDYGSFASDYSVLVKANEVCAADFGFDQLSVISDPYRETEGFGADIEFIKDGVPRCVKEPLGESRDLTLLRVPDPMISVRMKDRVDAVKAFSAEHRGEYSILGWIEGPAAEAADLRGVANFLMDMMDDPVYAGELMDVCLENGIAFAKSQVEAGADTIGIGDAIASQVSPDMYEKLIFPKEKKMIHEIHRAGALVRLHICGDITHLLPLIAELNVDILDVDHMVDMKNARGIMGEHVTLAGNIDPSSGVCFGDSDSIIEHMKSLYREVGNPFLVGAGCEIPAGTPVENLKALCEPIAFIKG